MEKFPIPDTLFHASSAFSALCLDNNYSDRSRENAAARTSRECSQTASSSPQTAKSVRIDCQITYRQWIEMWPDRATAIPDRWAFGCQSLVSGRCAHQPKLTGSRQLFPVQGTLPVHLVREWFGRYTAKCPTSTPRLPAFSSGHWRSALANPILTRKCRVCTMGHT